MNNGDQRSSLGGHNDQLSSFKVLHGKKILPFLLCFTKSDLAFNDLKWPEFLESCKLEIWSGDNFTGDRSECTGDCRIFNLGSVGNDRARSAKCSCAAPTTTRKWKLSRSLNCYIDVCDKFLSSCHHWWLTNITVALLSETNLKTNFKNSKMYVKIFRD